jgi:carboxyl-terminal processing protease
MNGMQNIRQKIKMKYVVGAVAALLIFVCGFLTGRFFIPAEAKVQNVENKDAGGVTTVDFAPFWKAWETINEKYVPTNNIGTSTTATTTVQVSDQDRVWGAISGMVDSLGDPYTEFFPPTENKSFNEEISGDFDGVGMEVDIRNGVLTVISPLKNSPAQKAGIKIGDQITMIDKTPTAGVSADDAVNLIRGPKGTTVALTIVRAGVKDPFVVSIVRDVIDIPTINTETIGDVFVIQLYSFNANSPDLFRDALRQFVESGKSKLIIDLRGNPGGYLDAAVDMASWFLLAGKTVVSEDYLNQTDNTVYRSKGYDIFNDNLKLAVLIDGGSASASEILAGALHDNGVATLVGQQSFGKGSVQELIPITDDTSLKVTIAKWLTPNGISISHQGLTPDVVTPLDEAQFLKGDDTQMDAAVQLLDK